MWCVFRPGQCIGGFAPGEVGEVRSVTMLSIEISISITRRGKEKYRTISSGEIAGLNAAQEGLKWVKIHKDER